MKKRLFALLLCLAVLLAYLPATAHAATEISKITLSGLRYPKAGETCSSYNAFTTETSGISFYSVDWYDRTDKRFLDGSDTFVAGHQYYVEIWAEAKSGYSFRCIDDNTPNVTATLDGDELEVGKAFEYKAFAMVTLTYYFPAIPPKGWLESVNLQVPAPVAGQKPDYTRVETAQYYSGDISFSGSVNEYRKNGISWYTPNNAYMNTQTGVFAGETEYIFDALLFPAEGYSFNDNTKVYVNGKLAQAQWDYGTFVIVKYRFPTTGKLQSPDDAQDPPAHTHTPSAWRTTQVYHYKVCTTCGEMLQDEDHKGGVATCAQKGKCSVCNYEYLDTNENHTPDTSKWIPRVEMYHFHACKLCGAHCDVTDHKWSPRYHAVDAKSHAYQCADCKGYDIAYPHNPGPAATEKDPQTCKDCGYVIAPAKNHTHQLTQVAEVAPTCTEPGVNAYYTCAGCSQKFQDAAGKEAIGNEQDLVIPPQGHQISNGWGYNEITHWRICAVCNARMIETDMAHEIQEGKCTTCEYDGSVPTATAPTEPESAETVPETTAPTPTQPQETGKDKEGPPTWAILLLAGLAAVGTGIGGGFLVVKLMKKKEE